MNGLSTGMNVVQQRCRRELPRHRVVRVQPLCIDPGRIAELELGPHERGLALERQLQRIRRREVVRVEYVVEEHRVLLALEIRDGRYLAAKKNPLPQGEERAVGIEAELRLGKNRSGW